jgi:hypothetical protein
MHRRRPLRLERDEPDWSVERVDARSHHAGKLEHVDASGDGVFEANVELPPGAAGEPCIGSARARA